MALFATKYLTVGAILLASSGAGAQAAPAKPACDIAETASGNAARATLSVNLAREAGTPAVAANHLKNAVKLLENTDKTDNPVVNAYVLGTAVSVWANQPGIGLLPKRGALGFVANPTGTLEIPATLDSLFKIVEAAKPSCAEFTAYWRAGQKFYLEVVNGAINALNADQLDSAEYYAMQANRLYSPSPYGTMVIGGVASKRGNSARAIEYWTLAAEAAARDTSYRDVRRQTLASIGSAQIEAGNAASGADKIAAYRKAADTYSQLIAVPGSRGQYLTAGRQQLQAAYLLAGDTAAAIKTWEALIANPSGYDYQDLLNSAVAAARANRTADAGKLFEATLAQNPNNRDALYNVAITYLSMEQYDKVGPIVERLVAVDPGNPENFNLAARAYLALGKAAQTAKKTSVAAAYNDTTLTWFNRGNNLPVEVTFTEFSPSDKSVTIGGNVTDRRDKVDLSNPPPAAPAAKSAKGAKAKPAPKVEAKTYPPKAVTLTFSAIDKTGQVVGTDTVTTEPLVAGQKAKFKITINAPNVVAYRYKFVD